MLLTTTRRRHYMPDVFMGSVYNIMLDAGLLPLAAADVATDCHYATIPLVLLLLRNLSIGIRNIIVTCILYFEGLVVLSGHGWWVRWVVHFPINTNTGHF